MSNNYGPRIVTDGLVLCLDAADKKSYPGSGTTWYDRSGNGNHGTLVNGPSFDGGNGGSIVFDGADDHLSTSLGTYTPYCIDIWFYNDDNITSSIMEGNYQQLAGVGAYPGGITLGAWTGAATDETFSFFGYNWSVNGMTYIRDTAFSGIHNIVVNWNGSTYDIWLDGTKRTTYASSYGHCTLHSRTGFALGGDLFNAASYEFDGKIYSAKIYISQLSDNEVLQNYNTVKGRFNL